MINLDEYADVGTHWIVLFCNMSEIVYFDSFGVEHVPEEIKKFVKKLVYLTMLASISTVILDMKLDLIGREFFHLIMKLIEI